MRLILIALLAIPTFAQCTLVFNPLTGRMECGGSGSGTTYTAGDGITITGTAIAMDSAVVPRYTTGAGAPSGPCTAGRDYYLDTTNHQFHACDATDLWKMISNTVFSLADTGGDDTYGNSTACAGFPAAYVSGQTVILQATTANTGAATLDCGPGVKAIKLPDGSTDPTTGDIAAKKPTVLQYDASGDSASGAWILLASGSASTQERSLYFPVAMRNTLGANNIALWQSSTGTAYTGATLNAYAIVTLVDGSTSGMTTRFQMPYDWNGGTVTAVVHNVGYGSSSAEQHRIGVSVYCVNPGNDLADDTTDMAFGTFSTQSGAANELSYWTISGITARNCTAGEVGFLTLHRIGADAADTSTIAMAVIAVEVRYVSNQ